MYNVLLADDELPALRFLETIITKYAPEFSVAASFRDGMSALAWLKENPASADLLITDIRMPDMDGITLAKAARNLRADLHIVIASGYQEFEYAHGAIEAAVDDYLLKPVGISRMKELLEKIRKQLDVSTGAKLSGELTALLAGRNCDRAFLTRAFPGLRYYFALLRRGNVLYPQPELKSTALLAREAIPDQQAFAAGLYILAGRDEKEFLYFMEAAQPISGFQNQIRAIAESTGQQTVTVVFAGSAAELFSFGSFYETASKQLRRCAVIGRHTESILPAVISTGAGPEDSLPETAGNRVSHVPSTILKQLELSISENNRRNIRRLFLSLGNSWDQEGVTQRQAYIMTQQLLHLVETVRRDHWKTTGQIMQESDLLTNTVSSYTELTEKLFDILFEKDERSTGQLTPEEMYRYAVKTIEEKFDQPISIQSVCSEIGISQTYLSRLFRKYGNTSFNTFLVQCRIENAQKLMKTHPDMPLHQIAACAGYDDYAYFSKVFRQIVGCSPSQFQANQEPANKAKPGTIQNP